MMKTEEEQLQTPNNNKEEAQHTQIDEKNKIKEKKKRTAK